MEATKEIKILLIRLFAQTSYSDNDRKAIAAAFNLHLKQSTIIVQSVEQKEIVAELMEKQ